MSQACRYHKEEHHLEADLEILSDGEEKLLSNRQPQAFSWISEMAKKVGKYM